MNTPLVSICLPTLNARRFLEERMSSIYQQTCSDWELIACDSHSTDGTWEYLESFRKDPRVHLHQVPREGLYAGWNECLKRAGGQYVHIATADDTFEASFLEQLLNLAAKNPASLLLHSDFLEIDEHSMPTAYSIPKIRKFMGGHLQQSHLRPPQFNVVLASFFGPAWVTMSSVLFRRDLLDRTGFFPCEFGSNGDVVWALEAGLQTNVCYFAQKLATWRRHPHQATVQPANNNDPWKAVKMLDTFFERRSVQLSDWWGEPARWKSILTSHQLAMADETLGLYRHMLHTEPGQFANGLIKAAAERPGYLLRQLLSGFPNPGTSSSLDAAAEAMLKLGVPWPP